MTNPAPHGQVPEALQLAKEIMELMCSNEAAARRIAAAADELCRLHAENERLAALVEAQQPAPSAAAFDEHGFRDWVLRNLPKGSIIGNGEWWADHLTSWAKRFVKAAPQPSSTAPAAGAVAGPDDYTPLLDDEGRMMVGTSHHYTAENIRALVAEYKALEAGGPDTWELHYNTDHRARAGVLWRVISALADEVPFAAPQPFPVAQRDALSDAVRVPLDSLHADAAYLIGRLREGSMPYARVIEIIRERIDAAFSKAQAAPAGRVISANCQYATVEWLQQTSEVGGGDPDNSRSWPITGDAVYLTPQPTPAAQAAGSVLEDAERWRELREQHESDEDLCCVFAPNDMRECLVPVSRLPGGLDAFMDSERAARKQGANHDIT